MAKEPVPCSQMWQYWWTQIMLHCPLILVTLFLAYTLIQLYPIVGWVSLGFGAYYSWIFISPCRQLYAVAIGGALVCWNFIAILISWCANESKHFRLDHNIMLSLLALQLLGLTMSVARCHHSSDPNA
eukprot:Blabericola_migrator_1__7358@NODE_373_length_9251_cov_2588_298889_g298_i0_p4_GENE_NODE_373_length_9251_cov_2588_298889_g298_i0NODE_373_length_9251_cov_2588_298889_g298_i0_p4_ORF_typecomplete_len128_score1_43DUF1279/PF06916_13/1YesK/PF14150_6/2_5YesK/PF14150_6/36_NODE_373_length_9251_cov_2588_298889_g298_i079718354